MKITIERDGPLELIAAHFYFTETCTMNANDKQFDFIAGDALRLFVSYRYKLQSLAETLASHNIVIENVFLSASGEEGVFVCGLQ